jgi:hypothetical protein
MGSIVWDQFKEAAPSMSEVAREVEGRDDHELRQLTENGKSLESVQTAATRKTFTELHGEVIGCANLEHITFDVAVGNFLQCRAEYDGLRQATSVLLEKYNSNVSSGEIDGCSFSTLTAQAADAAANAFTVLFDVSTFYL